MSYTTPRPPDYADVGYGRGWAYDKDGKDLGMSYNAFEAVQNGAVREDKWKKMTFQQKKRHIMKWNKEDRIDPDYLETENDIKRVVTTDQHHIGNQAKGDVKQEGFVLFSRYYYDRFKEDKEVEWAVKDAPQWQKFKERNIKKGWDPYTVYTSDGSYVPKERQGRNAKKKVGRPAKNQPNKKTSTKKHIKLRTRISGLFHR